MKLNHYGEDSNLTYSDLCEDEWRGNPRGNHWNDFVDVKRDGGAASHTYVLSRLDRVARFEATFFRLDFQNQITAACYRVRPAEAGERPVQFLRTAIQVLWEKYTPLRRTS